MTRCRPCRDIIAAGRPAPIACSCTRPADLTCEHGVPHWITGETAKKRADALAAWGGCGCTELPSASRLGEGAALTGQTTGGAS